MPYFQIIHLFVSLPFKETRCRVTIARRADAIRPRRVPPKLGVEFARVPIEQYYLTIKHDHETRNAAQTPTAFSKRMSGALRDAERGRSSVECVAKFLLPQ